MCYVKLSRGYTVRLFNRMYTVRDPGSLSRKEKEKEHEHEHEQEKEKDKGKDKDKKRKRKESSNNVCEMLH